MTGLKYDPPNFLKQGIIRLKEFYSSARETLKEWLQRDFTITILIFLAIFSLEFLLGTFYDTTTHWDAWTRAQNAMIYASAPLIKWIPFIPYSVVGLVWLPGHFYVLASLHLLTGIPTLYLGEIVSAIAAAGMICYVFLILRQYFNLPQRRAVVVSLLPLTSGMWVSYGSQCMSDILSLFLIVATLFHFGKFILSQDRDRNSYIHGLIGTLLATFNNLVRYEPWVIISGLVGLTFLIVVLFQLRRLVNKEGWENSLNQMAIKCIAFIILPTCAILMWFVFNYYHTGDFFYTTTWILEQNASWGTVQLTGGSLPFTLLVFFTRLNQSNPFWWLIPISLIGVVISKKDPLQLNKENKKQILWLFFIFGAAILFTAQMIWQIFSGLSTSEPRFFMTLLPFVSIALGFLSQHPRMRSKWLLTILFFIGFLNCVLYLDILHRRHLFFVEQDPAHVKP